MAEVARGHVRDRPFARTVYAVAIKRFTGDMIMTQGGRWYKVTWQSGTVVAADSPSPADSFGRVALTASLVTSTQLGDALRIAQSDPGRSQLQVLTQVARLSPQQVLTVKRRALALRSARIFALADASFVLDSAPSLARDPELAPLSARWLIYQGLRTHYDEERLESELTSALGSRFRLLPTARPALREYGFGADAKGCVDELGSRPMSIDDIVTEFPRMTRKAVMAMVYALLATDSLSVAAAQARPATGAATGAPRVAPQAISRSYPRPVTGPAPRPIPKMRHATERDSGPTAIPRPVRRTTSNPLPEAIMAKDGSRKIRIPGHRARKPRPPDPAGVERIRGLIASKLKLLDSGADHFQLLGVAQGAPPTAVQQAYFQLTKQVHPDRLQAVGIEEDPAAAHRLVASINQAYAVLSNVKKRAEYEAELGAGGPGAKKRLDADAQEVMMRAIEAEKQFQRGEIAARGNQWRAALEAFRKAVELNPQEAEHHALLAWAIWRNAADKEQVLGEVKQGFKRAITMSPRSVAAYLHRGRVAAELQDHALALDCFRKVLSLEPKHDEAQLQVRLIEGRLERQGKKKGLIDRLKRR